MDRNQAAAAKGWVQGFVAEDEEDDEDFEDEDEEEDENSAHVFHYQQVEAFLTEEAQEIIELGDVDNEEEGDEQAREAETRRRSERQTIIRQWANRLRRDKNRTFIDVQPIVGARVPILKVTHARTKIQCDIGVENVLGLSNTTLLKFYTLIDDRFVRVGFSVKLWANNHKINDASKGMVSSYAWVVLLIYYLQTTTPPVLPNLQLLSAPGEQIVDGCDTYFFALDSLQQLDSVWGGRGSNQSSVGDLFIGFLEFLLAFPKNTHVVSIRTSQPILKTEKSNHYDTPLAIEDPFELDHNLTKGLKGDAYDEVICIIDKSIEKLKTPCPSDQNAVQYYFGASEEEQARTRNVFQCHRCNKYGHFKAECPMNRGRGGRSRRGRGGGRGFRGGGGRGRGGYHATGRGGALFA